MRVATAHTTDKEMVMSVPENANENDSSEVEGFDYIGTVFQSEGVFNALFDARRIIRTFETGGHPQDASPTGNNQPPRPA
jgi:hypothetical protein